MGSLPDFSATAHHAAGTPIIQASLRLGEPRGLSSCVGGIPQDTVLGEPMFPVGPGLPCGPDWAALIGASYKILGADMEEESPFPSEGGCESCLCQERRL